MPSPLPSPTFNENRTAKIWWFITEFHGVIFKLPKRRGENMTASQLWFYGCELAISGKSDIMSNALSDLALTEEGSQICRKISVTRFTNQDFWATADGGRKVRMKLIIDMIHLAERFRGIMNLLYFPLRARSTERLGEREKESISQVPQLV